MKAIVTVDLGFGDSGKGTMVDYLCRRHDSKWVVRYNGGAQAGHNVVADNLSHTFSQFGSGTFAGANTFLSEHMMWNPIALVHESVVLSEKMGISVTELLKKHFIDVNAPIITPFHVAANRLREKARGTTRHGSCGKGVGELASDLVMVQDDVIRVKDFLEDQSIVLAKLIRVQARRRKMFPDISMCPDESARLLVDTSEPKRIIVAYLDMFEKLNFVKKGFLTKLLKTNDTVIFEGSQGVLLDEWYGFHPYTTWDTTVPTKAMGLLDAAKYTGDRVYIGILRSFMTRHGVGPFPTETKEENIPSINESNKQNEWQGNFRVGYFDFVLLLYAIECVRHHCPLDVLAITYLDVLTRQFMPYAASYRIGRETCIQLNHSHDHNLKYQEELGNVLYKAKPIYDKSFMDSKEIISEVQNRTGIKVGYGSWGPQATHKKEL